MSFFEPEASASPAPVDDRLSEVLRLTTALADQVLDAQIMKRAVPEDQVRALMSAAGLLREHDVEWPPLLTQVLHDLLPENGDVVQPHMSASDAATGSEIKGLSRLLGGFRKRKDQP